MTSKMTTTGKTILSIGEQDSKYDEHAKKLLACKPILARILKGVMQEFQSAEYTPEVIETLISSEIQVSKVPVEPGMTNTVIVGEANEDYQEGEGLVTYDIRTFVKVPQKDSGEYVKILINVEAQKDDTPGYDIVVRGIFYCCRMISAQLGTEFSNSTEDTKKYGNIKKVYSIFICTDPAKKRTDSIMRYSMHEEVVAGKITESFRHDLLTTVIINIGNKNSEDKLISMLSELFDANENLKEKLKNLKENHGLPITEEIEAEVEVMTTMAATLIKEGEYKGIEKGIEKGMEQGIEKVAINALREGMSIETVVKITNLTEEEVKALQNNQNM